MVSREQKNWYYFLDSNNLPLECSKSNWAVLMKGKRHLLTHKVGRNKVITSFVSHKTSGDIKGMFKTTVYNNINAIVYTAYYDDYDSAIAGHARTLEDRPWDMQR
jgi:hypothetical protein